MNKLAIHTMTTRPWSFHQAVQGYRQRGVEGISVWVETIESMTAAEARTVLDDAGMKVPALVRGGFFCAPSPAERRQRIDHNRELIETARTLGAEMIVLVVGAVPGHPLGVQRGWVQDAIAALLPTAEAAGVKIAIEPLHPMYAAERSCINRMREARVICESLDHPRLGIAVDVYHVWWDPELDNEIELAGASNRIFGFHLCDWRSPTRDLLNDRALMGDGCIDLAGIRGRVRAAGFDGWEEVEIFSDEHWKRDQGEYVDDIVARYRQLAAPATRASDDHQSLPPTG